MGSLKWKNKGKPWRDYEVVEEVDGIKVLNKKDSRSNSLPTYSDSSRYYATYNSTTGEIKQIACYDESTHAKLYDIDWSHDHGEFKKGEPHIHYYDEKGKSINAVKPNQEQLELYNKFKGRSVNTNV